MKVYNEREKENDKLCKKEIIPFYFVSLLFFAIRAFDKILSIIMRNVNKI